MEAIVNWFDDDDLFIVKYGLIISNFITIAVLLIVQRMKKNVPVETPNQVRYFIFTSVRMYYL